MVLIEAQCNGIPCVASAQVPMEARVLSNYKSIPLEESVSVWADAVVSRCGTRDAQAVCKVADAGYKIQNEAHSLLDKYRQLCNGDARKI